MDKKIQSSTIYTSIAKTKGGEEDYMLDDQQNIKNKNVKTILPLKISSICTHWFIRQSWKIILLIGQKLNNLLCKYAS
jgi:hypothetical protein